MIKKLFFTLIIFSIFLSVCLFRLDPDFGWHLRSGNDIRSNGITVAENYSYTVSGQPWYNHEWLYDLSLSLLYSEAGYVGLAIVFAVIYTVAVFISTGSISLLVSLIATVGLLPFSGVRTAALGVLFFSIFLKIIFSKNKKNIWYCLPLFLLWANLHGSFLLGLGVLALTGIIKKRPNVLVVFFLSSLITLINPFGYHLYSEIFKILFDNYAKLRIAEWQPLAFHFPTYVYLIFFGAVFLLVEKNPIKRLFSIPGMLLAMSFSSNRYVIFFIISTTSGFQQYLQNILKLIPKKLPVKKAVLINFIKITAFVGIIYGIVISAPRTLDRESGYPKAAVEYLRSNRCQGQIFSSYGFGGYLLWKLPGEKLYIDGRLPQWKNNDGGRLLEDYFKVYHEYEFRDQQFIKYDINCALLSKPVSKNKEGTDLSIELLAEGWKKIIDDSRSILLIKN